MTFIAEYQAAQDPQFILRCQVAAVAFAINVVESEAANTPNHVNRANYAKQVVTSPQNYSAQLALGVIALNTSTDGSLLDDNTVGNSIASIWNIYAGIV